MARLVRVDPGNDPGFRRVRAGRSFRYLDASGKAAGSRARRRIRDLVIPPAWEDVWIAAEPLAHIQAVGVDAAGRRQYLYHQEWRRRRDRNKYSRALTLAEALPHARARVTTALRGDGMTREKALAVAFRLLDAAAPRIGSTRYLARHGSRGLTTLRRRDASVDGSLVSFSFPGKSRQRVHLEVDDNDLASAITLLTKGDRRSPLLWFADGRRQTAVTASAVNVHIADMLGTEFSAKDFRTLRGTTCAAEALARIGALDTASARRDAERLAVRATAGLLGNTAPVARASYIDPRVFTEYRKGRILDLSVSAETAIIRLLGGAPAAGNGN